MRALFIPSGGRRHLLAICIIASLLSWLGYRVCNSPAFGQFVDLSLVCRNRRIGTSASGARELRVVANGITNPPCCTILYYRSGSYTGFRRNLILAVWPDGRILWSKNPSHGGAPLYSGQVAPGSVSEVLLNIRRRPCLAKTCYEEFLDPFDGETWGAYVSNEGQYAWLITDTNSLHDSDGWLARAWVDYYRDFADSFDIVWNSGLSLVPRDGHVVDADVDLE